MNIPQKMIFNRKFVPSNLYNYHQSLAKKLNQYKKHLEAKNNNKFLQNLTINKIKAWFFGQSLENKIKICSIYGTWITKIIFQLIIYTNYEMVADFIPTSILEELSKKKKNFQTCDYCDDYKNNIFQDNFVFDGEDNFENFNTFFMGENKEKNSIINTECIHWESISQKRNIALSFMKELRFFTLAEFNDTISFNFDLFNKPEKFMEYFEFFSNNRHFTSVILPYQEKNKNKCFNFTFPKWAYDLENYTLQHFITICFEQSIMIHYEIFLFENNIFEYDDIDQKISDLLRRNSNIVEYLNEKKDNNSMFIDKDYLFESLKKEENEICFYANKVEMIYNILYHSNCDDKNKNLNQEDFDNYINILMEIYKKNINEFVEEISFIKYNDAFLQHNFICKVLYNQLNEDCSNKNCEDLITLDEIKSTNKVVKSKKKNKKNQNKKNQNIIKVKENNKINIIEEKEKNSNEEIAESECEDIEEIPSINEEPKDKINEIEFAKSNNNDFNTSTVSSSYTNKYSKDFNYMPKYNNYFIGDKKDRETLIKLNLTECKSVYEDNDDKKEDTQFDIEDISENDISGEVEMNEEKNNEDIINMEIISNDVQPAKKKKKKRRHKKNKKQENETEVNKNEVGNVVKDEKNCEKIEQNEQKIEKKEEKEENEIIELKNDKIEEKNDGVGEKNEKIEEKNEKFEKKIDNDKDDGEIKLNQKEEKIPDNLSTNTDNNKGEVETEKESNIPEDKKKEEEEKNNNNKIVIVKEPKKKVKEFFLYQVNNKKKGNKNKTKNKKTEKESTPTTDEKDNQQKLTKIENSTQTEDSSNTSKIFEIKNETKIEYNGSKPKDESNIQIQKSEKIEFDIKKETTIQINPEIKEKNNYNIQLYNNYYYINQPQYSNIFLYPNYSQNEIFSNFDKNILEYEKNVDYNLSKILVYHEQVLSTIKEFISKILYKIYDIEFLVYGSYATGLRIESSDIDMLIKFKIKNKKYDNYDTHQNIMDLISVLENSFKKNKQKLKLIKINPIYTASVPVLKIICDLKDIIPEDIQNQIYENYQFNFDDEILKLNFDLTFHEIKYNKKNDPLPLKEIISYIKNIISTNTKLKTILLVLKRYMKIKKLNSSYSGGVSSYSLFLLLYAYFKKLLCDNPKYETQLGKDLFGFFSFYYNFNFEINSIDVKNENPVVSIEKNNNNKMVLIDPLTGFNVAKSTFLIKEIQYELGLSLFFMNNAIYSKANDKEYNLLNELFKHSNYNSDKYYQKESKWRPWG